MSNIGSLRRPPLQKERPPLQLTGLVFRFGVGLVGARCAHAGFDRRGEMFVFDLIERWCVIRKGAFDQKWIGDGG